MRCAFVQPTFIVRQSSVGSRSVHTDNPQGSRRAVASKTAPSQPKHDGAESQRGPRHVSSCRLIPACAKKKAGSQKTQRATLPRLDIKCDSSAQAEKTTTRTLEGRSEVAARMSQACLLSHIFGRVARSRARACALLRLRLGHFQPRKTRCFDFTL